MWGVCGWGGKLGLDSIFNQKKTNRINQSIHASRYNINEALRFACRLSLSAPYVRTSMSSRLCSIQTCTTSSPCAERKASEMRPAACATVWYGVFVGVMNVGGCGVQSGMEEWV